MQRAALPGFLANLLGTLLSRLLFVLVAPLYLALLGRGAIGLLGVYSTLLSMAAMAYHGFGRAAIRLGSAQLAPEAQGSAGEVVRTMEACIWALALALGGLLLALDGPLSAGWLSSRQLPAATVAHALRLMALLMLFQVPQVLYYNLLVGLQQHLRANLIQGSFDLLRWAGPPLLYLWIPPGVDSFFLWQAGVVMAQTLVFATAVWTALPAAGPRRVRRGALRELAPFILGVGAITVVSTLLTQSDRLILSRMLPLETFGAYVLVLNLARAVPLVVTALANVFVPRLCAALPGRDDRLAGEYHRYAQAVSVLVVAPALVAVASPQPVLQAYLHDAQLAFEMAPAFRLLVLAMVLSALWEVPYSLQLASGWTSFALRLLGTLLVICGPLMWALTAWLGVQGAAVAWLLLSAALLSIGAPATHWRLLPGELARWLGEDVARPVLAAGAAAALAALLLDGEATRWMLLLQLAGAGGLAVLAAAFAAPRVRASLPLARRWRW